MTTYTVNMSNVSEVVEQMSSIAAQINTLVQDLDSSTQSSLAEWTSSARDVFNQCKAKWDAAAADMSVQAQNASASLGSINENYALAEKQGSQLWSS
jgi:WXG100 family type VII secretion target